MDFCLRCFVWCLHNVLIGIEQEEIKTHFINTLLHPNSMQHKQLVSYAFPFVWYIYLVNIAQHM